MVNGGSMSWSFPNAEVLKNDIEYVCHTDFACDVAQGLQSLSQLFCHTHQFLFTTTEL